MIDKFFSYGMVTDDDVKFYKAVPGTMKITGIKATDNGVLNQLDVIKSYTNLQAYIESRNTDAIKHEIICIQHSIETLNLLWNYTLFLRLFKG